MDSEPAQIGRQAGDLAAGDPVSLTCAGDVVLCWRLSVSGPLLPKSWAQMPRFAKPDNDGGVSCWRAADECEPVARGCRLLCLLRQHGTGTPGNPCFLLMPIR